jgi:vacuolar-type H+-ATPase subunit E/Vma4
LEIANYVPANLEAASQLLSDRRRMLESLQKALERLKDICQFGNAPLL